MIDIQEIIKSIKKGTIIVEIQPGIFQATSAESNYIIEYDRNRCIGAASCAAIAPLTFLMDEENKAKINSGPDENSDEPNISKLKELKNTKKNINYNPNNNFDDDEVILEGAQSCPVLAIKIIDKLTGEVIFPLDELN
ncbi:ferredoxin [Candidatus Dojkabacteria bacterium]|uniref:Ferredoxin n=1 Tax=Candidatus Dojkabacteria bacterium TaxID=2099670 RepID=A0A3M0Z2B7_9BACT|nr:MAG: ferredoxin [Candidatus Dojkabacteria bacterium]